VYYDNNQWRYSDETTDPAYHHTWSGNNNQRDVYLIYGEEEDDKLIDVDTVENLSQYGISISMQNLNFNSDDEDKSFDDALNAVGGAYNGPVKQGLVQSRLVEGYPV